MVTRPTRAPSRGGFALVEAVVATVMLGVALATIIGLMSSALSSQRYGERLEVATMLAEEQLNRVLAVGPRDYRRVFKSRGQCDAPYEDYAYDVDIDLRSGGNPALVSCTIRWRAGSVDREVSIETMIAPRLGDDPTPDRRPDAIVERDPS
jgi:type II secretory pathway pseudopilin PulG